MDKTIAFIPARGGSKSIKFKNIKELHGRPMIYWVLDAAVGSDNIDRVYVATDSLQIKAAIESYSHPKVYATGRSEETATDTASTESAMLEFACSYEFEKIVLIQATSPLLKPEYLDEGISKTEQGYDSAMSVTRQRRFIWRESADGGIPVNYDPVCRPMRQDFDGFLVENGAFYITQRDMLLQTGCRISGSIALVEMPPETYFEVDNPEDWVIAEHFLNRPN